MYQFFDYLKKKIIRQSCLKKIVLKRKKYVRSETNSAQRLFLPLSNGLLIMQHIHKVVILYLFQTSTEKECFCHANEFTWCRANTREQSGLE